ncbi:MAG: ABC transporter permease [Myxococcota bacterium]
MKLPTLRGREPNPILVKELRTMFRSKMFIRFLYLSTGLLGLLVLSSGALMASGNVPPARVGRMVFHLFFGVALATLALVAPAQAAATITSERETGTYESLLLTGMDPARIVRGKLAASYASFVLVLVAFAPIVGIAFLFGGVAPGNVFFGFYGLLLVLAPAVGLGVALSARLTSTRVSVLLTSVLFAPAALFGTVMMGVAGDEAKRPWGLTVEGPFWFTEALATRFFEPDTFGLLVLLPLYAAAMSLWFFGASAVAALRPAAEDRSTPFKRWTLVLLAGIVPISAGLMALVEPSDVRPLTGIGVGMTGFVVAFLALLYGDEAPLPPRDLERRRREGKPLPLLVRAFGPGAVPTARFALLAVVAAPLLALVSHVGTALRVHPPRYEATDALGLGVLTLGNAAVGAALATFGATLRVALKSGVAARVLTLAVAVGLVILPLLLQVVTDAEALAGRRADVPLSMLLSPIGHLLVGGRVLDEQWAGPRFMEGLVPIAMYGLAALLCFGVLAARVRRVRSEVHAAREARVERARLRAAERHSQPSVPPPPAALEDLAQEVARRASEPPAADG